MPTRSHEREIDLHAKQSSIRYADSESGISAVALAAAGFQTSNPFPVLGFSHFQAWVITTGAGTVGVEIGALHPRTLAANTANCALGNLVAAGAAVMSIYFGIGLDPPASALGDKFRFATLITVTLRNNGAGPVTVTLDLEAIG